MIGGIDVCVKFLMIRETNIFKKRGTGKSKGKVESFFERNFAERYVEQKT